MVIDGHAHVSASDYGNVAALLHQLDQAGIDRALVVPGGMVDVRQMTRVLMGSVRPDPSIPNEQVYSAIDRHSDRIYGLVCINPRSGSTAIRMMEDGFRHGCRGVKLAPIVHQFGFNEPVLAEVAAACGERGFPLYTHVLPHPGCTTTDYAALAQRWPGTNFILGHMGFGPGDADAIQLAGDLKNLYLETSLGNYLMLREALQRLGPSKLIFGSEFPLSHPGAELAKICLLEADAQPSILAGNILRLLGATS